MIHHHSPIFPNTIPAKAMAMPAPPSPSLHLPKTNSSVSPTPPPQLFLGPRTRAHLLSFIPKATSDPEPGSDPQSSEDDSFESRVSQVRLRYRSGAGKKSEVRKVRQGKKEPGSGSRSGSGSGVFLPPVPLKEPVSGGVKVDFGFTPYSERVNGQLAGLGLVALLVVELATGKSVINYHTPAIVFIQVYFMAAASALYLKYEKEKVSVWPDAPAK